MNRLKGNFAFMGLLLLAGCEAETEFDGIDEDTSAELEDFELEDRSGSLPVIVIGEADVTDNYHGVLSPSHSACAPGGTCLLADLRDRYNGPGGWFRIENDASWFEPVDAAGIQHTEPGRTLGYNVDVDYNDFFSHLTDAQHNDLAVVASLTVSPHHPLPGGATPTQVLTQTFTGGADGFHQFEFEPNWVDSDVEIRIEVSSPLIDTPSKGYVWTDTRRVRSGPSLRMSPKFVPLAIVGRPPGANSWGELRQWGDRVVKTGVTEQNIQTSTHQTSGGIGPISFIETDRVTRERRQSEGTFQFLGYRQATNVRADSLSHRNGDGDLLVVLEDPEFDMWSAPEDIDFGLIDTGKLGFFPMGELVLHRDALIGTGPGSSNSFVQRLDLAETQALIKLNPLVTYPRWLLQAPRFHKLGAGVHGQGGSLHQEYSITAGQIANATSGTSTQVIEDDSSSVKLPVSAILKAIFGVNVPSALVDAYGNNTRIYSTEVELVRSLEILNQQGEVFAFALSDASGAEYCAEAYWDTLFNSVVFRDCGTSSMAEGVNAVYELAVPVKFVIEMLGEQETIMSGNLGGSKGKIEMRENTTEVLYVAEINEVGNFALPNVLPGKYTAKVEVTGKTYSIEVTEDGEIAVSEADGK